MVDALMQKEGGRGPDYVQKRTGRSCPSFSRGMTFDSDSNKCERERGNERNSELLIRIYFGGGVPMDVRLEEERQVSRLGGLNRKIRWLK